MIKKYAKLTAAQKKLCKPMSGMVTPATTVIVNPDGSILIPNVKVTPRVAKKWVELKHEKQRKLSPRNVEKWAGDMAKGKFMYTPDPIAFSVDGQQVNGNHRLNAILKSGVTCCFNVLLGTTGEAVMVMDAGAKRSVGQQLLMNGVDARGLTSPLSMALRVEHQTSADASVTTPQVKDGLTRYKEEIELISGLKKHHNKAFNGPPWGIILYVAKTHPEAAYEFAHGVCTREGLKAGDPALAFLNWLDRERRTGAGYSNGVRGTRKHALASARCLRAQVQKKRLDHVDGDSTQTNGKTKKGPVIKNECIRFPEEDVMKWLYSLRRPPKRKATAKRAAA